MTEEIPKIGRLIEIPHSHDLLWYHRKGTEWINIFNTKNTVEGRERISLGDARNWLKNNISEDVYFQFNEGTRTINDIVRPGTSLVLLFDSNDDYLAFKLVSPDLCKQDL